MDSDKLTQLPISRIRTVMKTSPSIGSINPDALFLMCRAAEMFIEHITKRAHKKGKQLDYKQLAAYVESEDTLEFLVQVLPKKITVSEYKKIMEEKKNKGEDESDSESEEDSDEDEENSSDGEESDDEAEDSSEAGSGSGSGSGSSSEAEVEEEADADSVISISSSSDEKENSKNSGNKKSPVKHKTGDSSP